MILIFVCFILFASSTIIFLQRYDVLPSWTIWVFLVLILCLSLYLWYSGKRSPFAYLSPSHFTAYITTKSLKTPH